MSDIINQVREGLEFKIQGLRDALRFVNDPLEIERLGKDLEGAVKALERLNAPDTRTPEEIEEISKLLNDNVEVESPAVAWSKLNPVEKFKYQIELYSRKLVEAHQTASKQFDELNHVCEFLGTVDFEKHPYLEPVFTQFKSSLVELGYSINSLKIQIDLKEKAISAVNGSFDSLDVLNQYLNNPMSLPHLIEKREIELEELKRDGKTK